MSNALSYKGNYKVAAEPLAGKSSCAVKSVNIIDKEELFPIRKIPFTKTKSVRLSTYQSKYARIFGNNPVLSVYLYTSENTVAVQDIETPAVIHYTDNKKTKISYVKWEYDKPVTGYIQILGSVKTIDGGGGGGDETPLESIITLAQLREKKDLREGVVYIISDYGGGFWYYDPDDTTSVDNTILCLVTPEGHRIKRFYDGNRINVEWAGAKGAHIDIQAEVDADFDSIEAIEMACRMVEYGGYRFKGAATVLYFPALAYNISRTWHVPPYCEVEFTNDSTTVYAMNHRPGIPFQGDVIVSLDGPGWPTFKFGSPRITVRDQSIPRNPDGSRKVDAKGVMLGGLVGFRIGACRDSTIGNITITGCYGAHGFEVKVTHPEGLDVENLSVGHIYTIRSSGGAIIATSAGSGSTYNPALGYRTGGRGQITDMQIRDCQFTTRDADNDPIEFIDEVWPIPFEILNETGSSSTTFGIMAERIFCASKNQTCFRIDGVDSGAMVANTFDRFTFEMQGKGNDGYASPGLARVDAMVVKNCHYNTFRGFAETIMPGHGLNLIGSYENTFDHFVFKNKSESDGFNNRFIRIDANSYRNKFTNIIFNLAFREDYEHQDYARAAGNGVGDGTQVQGDPNRYKIIDLGRENTFDTDIFKSHVTLLNSTPDFLFTDGNGSMLHGTKNYDTIQCSTNEDGNLELNFPPGDNQTFQTVNLPIERCNSPVAGIVIKYRFKQRDAGVAFQLYGQRPDIYDIPGTDWLYFTVLCPSKPVMINGNPNYDVENPFVAITSYSQDGNPKGRTVMEIQYIFVGMEGIPYVTGSTRMPNFMGKPYPGKLFTKPFERIEYKDKNGGYVGRDQNGLSIVPHLQSDATALTDGNVTQENGFVGIYSAADGGEYFGLSKDIDPKTRNDKPVALIAPFFKGWGIRAITATIRSAIWAVLGSNQTGAGKGNIALTVYSDNSVETFNNVLDDGAGNQIITGDIIIGPGKTLVLTKPDGTKLRLTAANDNTVTPTPQP